MSEAPKGIWCQSDTPNHMSDIRELAQRPRDEVLDAFTHYTRTDAISPQTAAKVLLEGTPNPMFDILKPTLMGEHKFTLPDRDEDGNEVYRSVYVPWDTMKLIIAHALRAIAGEDQP